VTLAAVTIAAAATIIRDMRTDLTAGRTAAQGGADPRPGSTGRRATDPGPRLAAPVEQSVPGRAHGNFARSRSDYVSARPRG